VDHPVLAERGLELGERLGCGAAAQALVGDQPGGAGHRGELAGEVAAVGGRGGQLVGAAGVLVEGAARELPPAGDALGADALVEVAAGELAAGEVGPVALAHQRPVQAAEIAARAERHPCHRLDAAGHDQVVLPAHHHARREVERALARAARAVDRGPGHRLGPARREHGVAADLRGLVAHLVDAAPQHVVDELGVDPRALRQRGEHDRGQVHRVHVGQRPAPLADRGSDGVDDDGFWHVPDGRPGWNARARVLPTT
jgi:hypothetical protein